MKITYTIWEGDPAILITHPNGAMEAYWLRAEKEWVETHPADIYCNGGIITKADFKGMVDDAGAPRPPIPEDVDH
jgi:hypothetical protein